MNVYTGVESFFCPDVAGEDPARLVDYTDVLEVLDHFGSTDAWWDIDGYDSVDISDALITLAEFGKECVPR